MADRDWRHSGFAPAGRPSSNPARPPALFGIEPCIVDASGNELKGPCTGSLCLKKFLARPDADHLGDHQRFIDTYFTNLSGKYFAGDGCRRDGDSYYWITGRIDDVLNVAGHRLGAAGGKLAGGTSCYRRAAVVGYPHDIKGVQGIYAYVTLKSDVEPTDALRKKRTGGLGGAGI